MHAPAAWARGMDAVLRDADAMLRRGPIPGQRGGRRAVLVVLLLAPLYGLCMGSYSVTSPDRLLMPVLIAAKMPILVTCSPKADPGAMRVSAGRAAQEILDERDESEAAQAAHARADHRQAA